MADNSHAPQLTLNMLSQARFLAAARSMVANLAQRLGFNEIRCGQISLAVDEALCNIINHGYDKRDDRPIWIKLYVLEPDRVGLKIVIEDEARQVEPDQIRSRDLDDIKPGGLGVYIIREIMDEVRYEKRNGVGMRLTMIKWLPDEDSDAGAAASGASGSEAEPRSSTLYEGDPTHERQ